MPKNRVYAFFVLLGLYTFIIPNVANADACRDRFVKCVEDTGSVPQCSLISRSCNLGNTGGQLDTRELKVTPSLFERGGKRWIQITIKNPNIHQVKLTNHTETLTCADGATFTAHLFFEGQILQGEDSVQSDPQVVCPGADFAANTVRTKAHKRPVVPGKQYACDPDQADAPVYDLHAMEGGNIKAESGNIQIVYDLAGGTAQGLFDALCGEGDLNANEKRDARILKLRGTLNDVLGSPESTPAQKPSTAPTGPRG